MKTIPHLFFPLLSLALIACSGHVDVAQGQTSSGSAGSGGAGASGSASTAGGAGNSTGTSGCSGPEPLCVHGCGSDWLEQANCVGGTWVCPPDTIDPKDCPSGTCWGPPFPCEQCGPNGWECHPDESCIGPDSCAGFVCPECTGAPDMTIIAGCQCQCDGAGQYMCDLAPGCCMQDMDCGDEVLYPCVNHVCKMPVLDGCWRDDECIPGQKCDGAVVCPCGALCGVPDQPGKCVPL
jgi:hypothetical protein